MQTFLPHPGTDFSEHARLIDDRRLHKQALEAWQILLNLTELDPAGETRIPRGWTNHPAVRMWRGHENTLHTYLQAMCAEWIARGYRTTLTSKAASTLARAHQLNRIAPPGTDDMPDWIRDTDLYAQITSSHRTALLVKDYEWYSQFAWPEDPGHQPDTYTYIWPRS